MNYKVLKYLSQGIGHCVLCGDTQGPWGWYNGIGWICDDCIEREFCMKYRRRSEKLDRYLKKRVKITYKDGTEKRGILMWSTANLKDTQGIKIRVGHYYILTKTGPAEIYKCSVKHIEEDFERA